jgi:hypothetical protein
MTAHTTRQHLKDSGESGWVSHKSGWPRFDSWQGQVFCLLCHVHSVSERRTDHSPPCSAKVRSAWSLLLPLLYVFMAWFLDTNDGGVIGAAAPGGGVSSYMRRELTDSVCLFGGKIVTAVVWFSTQQIEGRMSRSLNFPGSRNGWLRLWILSTHAHTYIYIYIYINVHTYIQGYFCDGTRRNAVPEAFSQKYTSQNLFSLPSV